MISDEQLESILKKMDSKDIPLLVDEINRIRSVGWIGKTIAYFSFVAFIFLLISLSCGVLSVAIKLACYSLGIHP